MSVEVILPKLGNSVESSIISSWLKQVGEPVAEGEPICMVETDKTTIEVVSSASGVLLRQLVNVGDDVPVLAPIAVVGSNAETPSHEQPTVASPRARKLAQQTGVDVTALTGSGPNGRIIERDVQATLALAGSPNPATRRGSDDPLGATLQPQKLTPVAQAMLASGGFTAPERGTGPSGRITKHDLRPVQVPSQGSDRLEHPRGTERSDPSDISTPLTGVRRIIAERMRASLNTTAQLTLNASADARAVLNYRKRLKTSDESLGLREVTINDLVLFAVAKTLPRFPDLNATLQDGSLVQHRTVHLAFAADTPRGLLVPVIRAADALSLRALAEAARALAAAAREGKLAPDQLSGGTFTVSNLGQFGIESFTPILNVPQVAILGVGSVNLKPLENDGEVAFVPHLGLSLTIDHQAVDGAPAAKFLQMLSKNLAQFEFMLAV